MCILRHIFTRMKKGRPFGSGGAHLTSDQWDEVERIYLEGKLSAREIGSLFGKSGECVNMNMKKRGIGRENGFRLYSVIDGKFSEPWTEEHSYWLGLLHADGHCTSTGSGICLELKASDRDVVEGFSRFVGLSKGLVFKAPINSYRNSSGSWTARFTSKKMHKDLTERGIVANNKGVWIPPVGLRDYLRGMFDGNGCISKRKTSGEWTWQYTGALCACELFQSTFKGLGIRSAIRKIAGSWEIRIKSTSASMIAQEYMYKDCPGPMMKRKAIFTRSEHLWDESGRSIPIKCGTSYDKEKKRFRAHISMGSKRINLGRHKTRGLAYLAYAKASLRMLGKRSPFWRNSNVYYSTGG